MKIICCCFGHREVYEDISDKLNDVLIELIEKNNVMEFWTGGMGKFDKCFSATVRKLKHIYPHIKLVLIKPYLTNDINENGDYFKELYDEIFIPDAIAGVHYKSAIKLRNRWMIDNSEFVITYVNRTFGGAYEAKRYAIRQGKDIFELSNG